MMPEAYDSNFTFNESILTGSYFAAAAISGVELAALGSLSNSFTRNILKSLGVINKQGEGPTEAAREKGALVSRNIPKMSSGLG